MRSSRPDRAPLSRTLARLQRSPRVADAIPLRLRALDICLTLLVLPIVLVVGTALALAILIDSPGPVFYRSTRIGRGGRPFEMLKFRTMRDGADGPSLSAKGDTRYTPLGRSLAASRFDELPQLWNVIKGDMRLVGPRPEVQEFVEAFPTEYEKILGVPPGLTGPTQLTFATEGRLLASAEDRADLYRSRILPVKVSIDSHYAERHSVLRDLRILVLTPLIPVLQLAAGIAAHHRGHLATHHAIQRPPAADARGERIAVTAARRAAPAITLALGAVALTALMVADATGPL
ncbi:MAG TPA: sugar transferase [Solirubrobacteraceae bacterium]